MGGQFNNFVDLAIKVQQAHLPAFTQRLRFS